LFFYITISRQENKHMNVYVTFGVNTPVREFNTDIISCSAC